MREKAKLSRLKLNFQKKKNIGFEFAWIYIC